MIPILILNDPTEYAITTHTKGVNVTPSGKAYKVAFQRPNGSIVPAWVPVSQSKIDAGMLWVADWLLEPRREGIGSLMAAGHKCLVGTIIPDTIEPLDTPKHVLEPAVIYKGYFTVEVEGEKHRTFKFKTNSKGQTIIGLLTGASNTTDYTWFAFVDGTILRYWKQPRFGGLPTTLPISREVANECLAAILGNVELAGLRYATVYSNCSRCGKVLTTPESLAIGLGPICDGIRYGRGK